MKLTCCLTGTTGVANRDPNGQEESQCQYVGLWIPSLQMFLKCLDSEAEYNGVKGA